MVPHGEVRVIWLQGVGRAAEEHADVVRVVLSGVEVSVVADGQRQVVLHLGAEEEALCPELGVVLQEVRVRGGGGEDGLQVGADLAVEGTAQGSKGV